MKRSVSSTREHVCNWVDLPSDVVFRILVNHFASPYPIPRFSQHIITTLSNFSLTSQGCYHLLSTTSFTNHFKIFLIKRLNIQHLSAKDEKILAMLVSKREDEGVDKRVWFYVYKMLWWVEKRMNMTDFEALKTDTLKLLPFFLKSPHPIDMSIISIFYPYNPKLFGEFIAHLLKSKQAEIPERLYEYEDSMTYHIPDVLDSIDNVFVTKEQPNILHYGKGSVCFTLDLNGSVFFCVVSVKDNDFYDSLDFQCLFVDVKRKCIVKIEELEKLMRRVAFAVSDEMFGGSEEEDFETGECETDEECEENTW